MGEEKPHSKSVVGNCSVDKLLVEWSVVCEESGAVSQESYVEVVVHIFVHASSPDPLVTAVAG